MGEVAEGRVVAEREGAVGRIVVDNPARRNAMSLAMWRQGHQALRDFAADPSVRAIVVAGRGEKAFVSGADISRFAAERQDAAAAQSYDEAAFGFLEALRRVEKPTVAAIRGYCMGGGVSLAVACDLRLCDQQARFGVPAARLGLGYGANALARLAAVVGEAGARWLLLTGEQIDADRASRMGLVHEVVQSSIFGHRLEALVEALVANAPLTLRAVKIGLDEISENVPGLPRTAEAVKACFASSDFAEGRRAFLEKRPPRFSGR
ncbi:MAG: enoyl-CoA hydratase [Alphaproteobacteria bacterium]|nr:enoyl-CoA hydratase [Alphaproteobacteria bacterium]